MGRSEPGGVPVRTSYERFTIAPASGAVTDRPSGREVGYVRPGDDGNWRGAAYLADGTEYPVGPWATAFAAADAVHLLATAGQQQRSKS
jgi:hypothetical protein